MGLLWFPGIARQVKTQVQALKARQFVEAARELGLSDAQILWKEIIWANTRAFLLSRFFFGLALAVLVETSLSYLNLGVVKPGISWGNLITTGKDLTMLASGEYWLLVCPALAIVLTTTSLLLLDRGIRTYYRIPTT